MTFPHTNPNLYAAPWPPLSANVVKIKAHRTGDPRCYVATIAIVIKHSTIRRGYDVVEFEDGYQCEVLKSLCKPINVYTARRSLANADRPKRSAAERKRPEAINPEHGTELTLPIQGVR